MAPSARVKDLMSGTCGKQGNLDERLPSSGFEVDQDVRHGDHKRGNHPRNTGLSFYPPPCLRLT
jgi:hypothetical protein